MSDQLIDTPERRKARGAFFTPSAVCDFIARWAVRDASDAVIEPSCGEAAILLAAARRLRGLGGTQPVRGYELHDESARRAALALASASYPARVETGDFLATVAQPVYTAAVGNPPYIRYQGFAGDSRATGMRAALAQGVSLSNMASSWAPFVIHTVGFLRDEGRLAFVLPAELLSSNYASEVRDYLITRFSSVKVVLFDGHVFPGVQTEALLLLAEGSGGTDHVDFAQVKHVRDLADLRFDISHPVTTGQRWTSALVSEAARDGLASIRENGFVPLSEWGRVSLGIVTGNNRFFTLSPHEVRGLRLTDSDVVSISPAGSGHLRALTFTEGMRANLGSRGLKTYLFRPNEPSAAGQRYIAMGEEQGVHQAYKCRVRSPWWKVPLTSPADLLFTYMNAHTPQLAHNPARLLNLNSVHGVYLLASHQDLADVLPLACLNSITALSSEVVGRAYGGGVLKMEPRESARLLVPSPSAVRAAAEVLRPELSFARTLLTEGRLVETRQRVDDLMLREALGLSTSAIAEIAHSQQVLASRRYGRARKRARSKS